MATCDCEVYEICPSCAPSEAAYAKAAEAYDKAARKVVADDKRVILEHSLATAFVKWTREKEPGERTRLWVEMHEIAKKLEQLDNT